MINKDILRLSVNIGAEIIANGGEISRAEYTVIRLNKAYSNECEVFALPSVLLAQSGDGIIMRRIRQNGIDLSELERLNALSRKLCANPPADIHISHNRRNYLGDALFNAIAVACFSVFFGGGFTEAICALILGFGMALLQSLLYNMQKFSAALTLSFTGALAVLILKNTGLDISTDAVITGLIMLLVPGITVTTAARDAVSSNIIAGLYGMLDSVTTALAIAFGVAGAIFLCRVPYA